MCVCVYVCVCVCVCVCGLVVLESPSLHTVRKVKRQSPQPGTVGVGTQQREREKLLYGCQVNSAYQRSFKSALKRERQKDRMEGRGSEGETDADRER